MFDPLPLSESTLETLLSEGGEYDQLDYKGRCNLNNRGELVELVKDLGAMQIYGGYIVVGADDAGLPTGDLTESEAKLFDEATLRSKIERYLTDFDIRAQRFVLNGNHTVLICVRPHPDGWAVFQDDGTYVDDRDKPQTAFRHGETFARHGSRSERWTQADARKVREELRRQEREAAKAELRDEFSALASRGTAAQAAAAAPATTLTLDLDPEALNGAVIEQMRREDTIPVTLLLRSASARVIDLAREGSPQLDVALDRLIGLGGTFSTAELPEWQRKVIDVLDAVYNATFDQGGLERRDLGVPPDDLRFRIVTRVFALGALLTRNGQWNEVRYLSSVRPRDYQADYWQNWLFHGDVMAARAGFHHEGDGSDRRNYKSTLVFAQEHIIRLPELRPDVPADEEAVITSLCQFSMLACFVALSAPEGKEVGSCLAHFGRWFAERTDAIVVNLIDGGPMRQAIFPGGDEELADAVRAVGQNARAMSHAIHGWHGYEDERILRFLAAHGGQSPSR